MVLVSLCMIVMRRATPLFLLLHLVWVWMLITAAALLVPSIGQCLALAAWLPSLSRWVVLQISVWLLGRDTWKGALIMLLGWQLKIRNSDGEV